jgi:ribosomal protein S18 acetylase RimI-like enzyme
LVVRPFNDSDASAVIALWHRCDLTRPWNDPGKDIARKLRVQSDLFLVGELEGAIIGSVMAGYDGHRGWVNYLAVDPAHRGCGYGRNLMEEAERRLQNLGCPKINLQIRTGNRGAIAFYEHIGYRTDDVLSMGKRLEHDGSGPV